MIEYLSDYHGRPDKYMTTPACTLVVLSSNIVWPSAKTEKPKTFLRDLWAVIRSQNEVIYKYIIFLHIFIKIVIIINKNSSQSETRY
jgi:hypothetical protein